MQEPWALSWCPKDDEVSWLSISMTAIEFYKVECGVDLLEWFEVGYWDDTKGGRAAHSIVWPKGKCLFRRGLPHQTRWLKNRLPAKYGGKEWGTYLAGEVRL